MMKQVLKIGGWSIFTIGILVLLVFVNAGYDNITTTKPEVEIIKPGNHNFVTEEKVITLMNDLGYHFDGQKLGDIEINRIEEKVKEIPGVKNVEAYKFNNGKVKIDIEQQLPIARVFLADGKMGFYIDEDGEIIPLSSDYVAKVPVFTGSIYEPFNEIPSIKEIAVNDSISDLHVLDEVYELALAISKDDFLSAQIVQVFVTWNEEFELIPRVGNHRVLLGTIADMENKLSRLVTFYTSEDINVREMNLYDTLNLKYKNQIVCSKKN